VKLSLEWQVTISFDAQQKLVGAGTDDLEHVETAVRLGLLVSILHMDPGAGDRFATGIQHNAPCR